MTTLVLVRHAESAPSPALPEGDWPLSADGRQQARELSDRLETLTPGRIVSSPYVRAWDTVAPLAETLGLCLELVDDLRERDLSRGMIPNFMDVVERAWRDFDFALPGCESSRVAQARAVRTLRRIAEQTPGETIVVASHGNLIGLFLNHLRPAFGFEAWRDMPNPAVYFVKVADDGAFAWIDS